LDREEEMRSANADDGGGRRAREAVVVDSGALLGGKWSGGEEVI